MEGAALLRELQVPGLHRVGQGEAPDEDCQQPRRLGRPQDIQQIQLGLLQVQEFLLKH